MKTKDKEITAEVRNNIPRPNQEIIDICINLHKAGKNHSEGSDGYDPISAAKDIESLLSQQKANEKELLGKCWIASRMHEQQPKGDGFPNTYPDFETWYNQLKNQKENG